MNHFNCPCQKINLQGQIVNGTNESLFLTKHNLQNVVDKLLQNQKRLEAENASLKEECTQKCSLQTLVDELLANQNKLENINNELMKKQHQYEDKIKEAEENIYSLTKGKEMLNRRLAESEEECKGMHLEINQLKNEVKEMRKRKRIDITKYVTWSSDDVVDWS